MDKIRVPLVKVRLMIIQISRDFSCRIFPLTPDNDST